MKITAITVDFWGTLLFDPPSSDDRYKDRRVKDFEEILAGGGLAVSAAALDRAYDESGAWLARVWKTNRDVPVAEHVARILEAVDPALAVRAPRDVLDALVEAYARPALVVPPAVDGGARGALRALCDAGYRLALVSNTMRTPGVALRELLARYDLLGCFADTVFSDEVGVRKPAAEIFAHALRALRADATTAVHVGDDSILDVEGARAAGMRVIQVTSASARSHRARRPDATIPSLASLPAAIARLELAQRSGATLRGRRRRRGVE